VSRGSKTDAATLHNRGPVMQRHEGDLERLARKQKQNRGNRATARMLPSPSAPLEVVHVFVERHCRHNEALTLLAWNGGWWMWKGPHWVEVREHRVRQRLYSCTEWAFYIDAEGETKPWSPNKKKISDLLDALHAVVLAPDDVDEQPCWLDDRDHGEGPFVSVANGLLDISSEVLHPHTPRYFNQTSVPFDYDPAAPPPRQWLAFLNELWPEGEDPEAANIKGLGEWFGYVVSGRTDLHKIFLMVGPTRGGKGTIARILQALVGRRNTCGPTLNSLGGEYGLAPLIGKSLAVVSDVRFSGKNSAVVVERLLSISGEDTLTINIKYREQWSGKLPCRLHVMSNELPKLGDASTAIVGRFVLLQTSRSWLGRENYKLEAALRAELPGILNWALAGLKRLTLVLGNQFTAVPESEAAIQLMRDLASPVAAFVRERCWTKDRNASIGVELYYGAFKEWCDDAGYPRPSKHVLGRDLRAVCPWVRWERMGPQDARQYAYTGIRLLQASDRDEES
jgi:putative DNA primase/helicase